MIVKRRNQEKAENPAVVSVEVQRSKNVIAREGSANNISFLKNMVIGASPTVCILSTRILQKTFISKFADIDRVQ